MLTLFFIFIFPNPAAIKSDVGKYWCLFPEDITSLLAAAIQVYSPKRTTVFSLFSHCL